MQPTCNHPFRPGLIATRKVKKKGRGQKAEGRRYKTIQWGLEPPLIEDHQPPVWWGLGPVLGKAGQRSEVLKTYKKIHLSFCPLPSAFCLARRAGQQLTYLSGLSFCGIPLFLVRLGVCPQPIFIFNSALRY
jgi:hypothetical protein